MPLIRYNLDDFTVPTDERCGCGRSWPVIKQIIGRMSDFFTMPSGRKITPWLLQGTISKESRKNMFLIKQYQIVQESRDKILVKIVEGRDFDPEIIPRIKRGMADVCYKINERVDVEINLVDRIPRDRTGKRREFISLLER
jgi:phenylacetate-CoA ligase